MRYEDASGTFQASGPIANDDADTLTAGSRGPATGNLITGEGTQYGSAGADSAAGAHVTAIAGKGGEDSSFSGGKLSVAGEHGQLSVDAEGNYSYLANAGAPENVRDRFIYTLADNQGNSDTAALVVEIGKTPVVIKADAQQVIVGPDGVVTLPPGVELSDIMVVGRNLVVNMPDGTQLVIVDGAIFVPQLMLGGVEVPATNVAALLIGQEVQPAAGETPPSGGGNFALPPPPLDPGIPLGDLLPPTEYNYIPPEPQEVFDILDEEPEAGAAAAQLDDDALAGGIAGGTGDDPDNVGTSGFLPGSGGDGDLTWSLLLDGAPAGFTYVDGPGESILVQQGGVTVLTITIDPATGEYSVVQNAPIDHAAGQDENNVEFVIGYVVTDEDGDTAEGTLTVNVDDDTPTVDVTVAADGNVLLTTQDAETDGNPTETDTASSAAHFGGIFGASSAFGADGAGSLSLAYALSTTGGASGLTSHGAAINLYLIGGVVVGSTAASAGAVNAGNTVFDISVDANGVVTVNQYSAIDHTNTDPSPTEGPFEDHLISLPDGAVTLTRTGTITDGDGDTVTDSASVGIGANIRFADDGPIAAVNEQAPLDTVVLDETRPEGTDTDDGDPVATLPNGDASATINFADNFVAPQFGADGPGTVTYKLLLSGPNVGSGLYALEPGDTVVDADGYGQGAEIVLNINAAGTVITGSAGGVNYFTITIDPATGIVTFAQLNPIWHPVIGDFDEQVTLMTDALNDIQVQQTVTDFDGDTDTAAIGIGRGVFSIQDDGPDPYDPCPEPVVSVNDPDADPFTGDLNLPDVGEDEPGVVTFGVEDGDPVLDSEGNPVTSGEDALFYFVNGNVLEARVGGESGELIFTITLNGDGTFTYDQIGQIGTGGQVVFDNVTSSAAGNVLYRGIGEDDAATDVDILLSGSDGAGADDGVNTDSDSIGVDNQSVDLGETVRLDFVSNLETPGVAPGTPTGFGYDGHVDTNSYIQTISQVQGTQTNEVAFQVWALNTSDTQADEPDRNPVGGFANSTITAITTVTVIGFDVGESTAVTVPVGAVGVWFDVAYGISAQLQADGSVIFTGVQEGDQYGIGTGGGTFNAVAVQSKPAGTGPDGNESNQDSFDLGVFAIGSESDFEPVDLEVPIVVTDADGDPVECHLDIHIGVPLDAQDISVTVNEAGLPIVGSDAASNSETQSGALAPLVSGGTPPFSFAFAPGEDGNGAFGTLVLNPDTGEFTYTLDTTFDSQPDADDGTNPELNAESFDIVVTDDTGATQTITVKVNIIDDVPSVEVSGPTSVTEGQTINGTWEDVIGADQAGASTVVLFNGSEFALGAPINTGKGTLTVLADGTWTFQSANNLDQDVAQSISFSVEVTDGDGDVAVDPHTITINDGPPPTNSGPISLEVDDDALANGSNAGSNDEVDSDVITFNAGSDALTVAFGNSVAGLGGGLTWTRVNDTTIEGRDGGTLIVTLSLTGTLNIAAGASGNVTVTATLADNYDSHPTFTVDDLQALGNVQVVATDQDGDSSSAQVNVSVSDDVPDNDVAGPTSVVEGSSINGTWTQTVGADQPGHTTVVVFNGTEYALGTAINTGNGTLTVLANGTWTFNSTTDGSISFTLKTTDADDDEATDLHTITINDGAGPQGGDTLSLEVDDDALSDGSNSASTDETDSGTLTFTAGSDPLTDFAFSNDLSGLGGGLTWVRVDDTTIEGRDGGTLIVTLTLNAPASIAANASGDVTITATLSNNYDSHPTFTADDLQALGSVTVIASEADPTDFATGTVSVSVSDDVPDNDVAGPTSVTEGASINGTWTQTIGADQPGHTTVVTFNGTDYALGAAIDTGKGTLTVLGNGTWTFQAANNLDHDFAQSISFTLKTTDADGDVATDPHTITINDGPGPTNSGPISLEVDDDALPNGNNSASTDEVDSDTITFTAGSDSMTIAFGNSVAGLGGGLTWTRVNDTTIEGRDGGNLIVTLSLTGTLNVAAGGNSVVTVTATLADNYDSHPTFTADDLQALGNVQVVATDIDGDTTSAQVNVSVSDDVPDNDVVGPTTVVEGQSINGTWTAAPGADQPGHTTVVTFNGTDYALGAAIDTGKGTLTVLGNGTWTFQAANNLDHDAAQSISFTLKTTDADLDVATDPHTINITDGAAPSNSGPITLEVDDEALPSGTNAASTAEVDSDTITFNAGSDNLTIAFGNSVAGLGGGLTWTRVNDTTIEGRDGGNLVVTLSLTGTLNVAAGGSSNVTVTATLADNYDSHPTINVDDLQSLGNVQVVGSDHDGDSTSAQVNVGVSDDVPVITLVTDPLEIDNVGPTPSGTGDFAFDVGADENADNDDISVSNFGITINGEAATNVQLFANQDAAGDPSPETATTASYRFTFQYDTGSGGLADGEGTLVFNKATGKYTVTLTSGPIEGFSTLQTAQGTAFVGYELNDSASDPDVLDNTQPQVAVTTILEESAPGANDGFYVQFTGFSAGNANHETINYDLVDPATGNGVDSSWTEGELFSEGTGATALTQSWVSVSNSSNGVAGDTVNGPDALNFSLYSSNPGGTFGGAPTASASDMFLVFDGTDSGDDFIVVLKLFDPDSGEYTTKSIVVEGGDIYFFDSGSEAATVAALAGTPYEGVVADIVALGGSNNNDGLVIIESNDYNTGSENWVIVGAQIVNTNKGVTGTGINLDGGVGEDGNSTGTQSFAVADDTAPMKITNIGFLAGSSNDQQATIEFDVTITDDDGDTVTQQDVTVNIGGAVSPGNLPESTMMMSSEPANDDVSFSSLAYSSNDNQKWGGNSHSFGNVGNTGIVSGMVAAAGMNAMAAFAPASFGEESFGLTSQAPVFATQMTSRMQLDDGSISAMSFGGDRGASFDMAQLPGSGHGMQDWGNVSNQLDIGSMSGMAEAYRPTYAADLAPASGGAASASPVAPAVAMVSAEMLMAASLAGGEPGGVQHTGAVEMVLADALGQGAPTVDGLLAHLPGGIGDLAAISNLASPAAGDVPGWDMAMHGGSGFGADMLTKLDASMLQHHDAVQPAVNG